MINNEPPTNGIVSCARLSFLNTVLTDIPAELQQNPKDILIVIRPSTKDNGQQPFPVNTQQTYRPKNRPLIIDAPYDCTQRVISIEWINHIGNELKKSLKTASSDTKPLIMMCLSNDKDVAHEQNQVDEDGLSLCWMVYGLLTWHCARLLEDWDALQLSIPMQFPFLSKMKMLQQLMLRPATTSLATNQTTALKELWLRGPDYLTMNAKLKFTANNETDLTYQVIKAGSRSRNTSDKDCSVGLRIIKGIVKGDIAIDLWLASTENAYLSISSSVHLSIFLHSAMLNRPGILRLFWSNFINRSSASESIYRDFYVDLMIQGLDGDDIQSDCFCLEQCHRMTTTSSLSLESMNKLKDSNHETTVQSDIRETRSTVTDDRSDVPSNECIIAPRIQSASDKNEAFTTKQSTINSTEQLKSIPAPPPAPPKAPKAPSTSIPQQQKQIVKWQELRDPEVLENSLWRSPPLPLMTLAQPSLEVLFDQKQALLLTASKDLLMPQSNPRHESLNTNDTNEKSLRNPSSNIHNSESNEGLSIKRANNLGIITAKLFRMFPNNDSILVRSFGDFSCFC